MRCLHALHFAFTNGAGLIVWPASPPKSARPVERHRDWLDVTAGDDVYVKGKRFTVRAVSVYRADGGPVDQHLHELPIKCGREWTMMHRVSTDWLREATEAT